MFAASLPARMRAFFMMKLSISETSARAQASAVCPDKVVCSTSPLKTVFCVERGKPLVVQKRPMVFQPLLAAVSRTFLSSFLEKATL